MTEDTVGAEVKGVPYLSILLHIASKRPHTCPHTSGTMQARPRRTPPRAAAMLRRTARRRFAPKYYAPTPGPTPVPTPALTPHRHAPSELHPALQLCAAVLPGDASPVQLHCQALRVPMQALLRPLSSPPPLGPSASVSEFFRTWSTLPARAILPGN